ncbi:hypothetical protein CRU90_03135 [Arcobacter cloacae]|uniref:Serine protease n=2 Tax=Arcobacter cloacae TaxID=1054034 RepID=A0A4Q0ZEW3_9BACT|nr:hypothetical protein CRU90_03135 [Arcobacter cloacae]
MLNPAHSVVHLTMRFDKTELAVGSGVLYLKDNKTYVVTAWHNISGRHTETLDLLNKNCSIPNNIIVSMDVEIKQGDFVGSTRISITVPLVDNNKTTYFIHPQGYPKVDVVAIPIDLNNVYTMEGKLMSGENINLPIQLKSKQPHGLELNIIHIQDCEFKDYDIGDYSKSLYVSDDIFVIGYPKGITDYTGQPIWKRATIATSPQLGWEQQEQFLVDCASKEGMSGAPAIYYSRDGKINTGNVYYKGSKPITILHGIYVGRLGSTSELEAQIGKVWKRKIIDEIIDNKILDFLSEELILSNSCIKQTINEEWPKENEGYANELLNDKTSYRYYFLNLIMSKINGRANKEKVLELILEYAETLKNGIKQ